MADQTDVQQLIQGLSSGSNNGNPNTAYNNAPGMPMMDAQGNWFLQNLPTAASLNMGSRAPAGGGTGWGTPTIPSLPPLNTGGGGGGGNGWGLPPPTTPPTVDVVTGGGGGGTSPTVNNPVSLGGAGGPGGGGNPSLPGNTFTNIPPLNSYTNQWIPTGGYNGGDGAINYGGPERAFDWRQMLDAASEPFLSGNFWQEGSQKWDFSNMLESVLNRATGGLATVGKDLGVAASGGIDALLQRDPSTLNAAQRAAVDHYMDNAQNKLDVALQSGQDEMGKSLSESMDAIMKKAAADSAARFGMNQQSGPGDLAAVYKAIGVQGMASKGYNASQINAASKAASSTGAGIGIRAAGAFTPANATAIQGDAARAAMDGLKGVTASGRSGGNTGNIRGHIYEQ